MNEARFFAKFKYQRSATILTIKISRLTIKILANMTIVLETNIKTRTIGEDYIAVTTLCQPKRR